MKRLSLLVVATIYVALLIPAPAHAQSATIDARIDNLDVARSTDDRPIELAPRSRQVIQVLVHNNSSSDMSIRSIRLKGDVMGLTFFSYDTAVGMKVPAGRSGERRFELDLFGLDGQAVGLFGAKVIALDNDRQPVAETPLVADVRGSLKSVYGLFGLAISAFTLLTFADALIRLRKGRLPAHRWARGLRFMTPGAGLGLSLIFTLSALRIYHPTTGKWVSLLFGSAALFFLLGYLTPAPDSESDELEAVQPAPELESMPSVPVRPAGGGPSAAPLGTALATAPSPPEGTAAEAPAREGTAVAPPAPAATPPAREGTAVAPPAPAATPPAAQEGTAVAPPAPTDEDE